MRSYLFVSVILLLTSGCESAYYDAMERLGIPKREILVDRITEAQQAQQAGQEQFVDALEQFRSVVNFDGGELQQVYDNLNTEFEASETAAERIRTRIDEVESVAEALFEEWNDELDQYTNASLRRDSEQQLRATRTRYTRLIDAMHRAEATLDPVLDGLRDNVLYLKHNLNARAVTSLSGELDTINTDVEQLITAMQVAIAESERFIAEMDQE
ncbi:MAG: DUF2959 domain-containing protein [Pseudomonadota bacterium]